MPQPTDVLAHVDDDKLLRFLDTLSQAGMDKPLPPWAYAHADPANPWAVGAQLATKDGRRTGNGRIVDTSTHVYLHHSIRVHLEVFEVVTDAGNTLRLTLSELEELFYPPKWLTKATPLEESQQKVTELEQELKDLGQKLEAVFDILSK